MKTDCIITSCSKPAKGLGLCSMHYERQRKLRAPGRAIRRRQPANPFAQKASSANKKARKIGAIGSLTAAGLRARFDYFGHRCWVCGGPGATTPDHVIPFFKGGMNVHANIRPAHAVCNNKRTAVETATHHLIGRTHCKNGHEWTSENLIPTPKGYHACKICARAAALRHYHRKAKAVAQ